jgi:hypothetical protein
MPGRIVLKATARTKANAGVLRSAQNDREYLFQNGKGIYSLRGRIERWIVASLEVCYRL